MTTNSTPRDHALSIRLLYALACAAAVGFLGGRMVEARAPYPRVHKLISTGETVVGETIRYPAASPAQLSAAIVALQPGEHTGWHRHGVPVFGYMLEGELTVDYGDKGQRIYRSGEGFAEAIDIAHDGRNTGEQPMRVLAVFMGAKGHPSTIAMPDK